MEDENIPEGFEVVEETSIENIPDGFEVVDDVELTVATEPNETEEERKKREELIALNKSLDGWEPDQSILEHNPNHYEELGMMYIDHGKYQTWKRIKELETEGIVEDYDPLAPPVNIESETDFSIDLKNPSDDKLTIEEREESDFIEEGEETDISISPNIGIDVAPIDVDDIGFNFANLDDPTFPEPLPQNVGMDLRYGAYGLPDKQEMEVRAEQFKYEDEERKKGLASTKNYYAKQMYGSDFKVLNEEQKDKVNKRVEDQILIGDKRADDDSHRHYSMNIWDPELEQDRTSNDDAWVNKNEYDKYGITEPYFKITGYRKDGTPIYSTDGQYIKDITGKQQQWVDHESDLYKNKDLRYLKFVAKKNNPGISDTEAEEMAKDVLDGRRKDFTRKYFNDEMKALEKANDDYEAAVEKYGAESEEAAKAGKILSQAHKNFTEAEMLFDPGTGEFKNKDKFTKAEQGNLAEYNESIDQRAKELAETTDREDLEDLSNDLYYDLYALNKVLATRNGQTSVRNGMGLMSLAADEIRNENGIAFLQGTSIFNYGIDYITGSNIGTSMKFKNPLAKHIDNNALDKDIDIARKMNMIQLGDDRLPFKLSHLPGNSSFAQQYNAKLDEFLSLQKAIQLNYDPTTLEKTNFIGRAFSNIGPTVLGESSTYRSESADQLAKDFVSSLKQGGYEMSDEVEERIKDTTTDLIFDSAPQLANFLIEMWLLKGTGRAAGAGKLWTNAVNVGKGTKVYQNSRLFKHTYDILAATVKEVGIGMGINQMESTLTGHEGMSLAGWGSVGAGQEISNKMMKALLGGKIPGFGNIMHAMSKSKIAQGFTQGTMQATASTGVMAGAEMFDAMVSHDKTFGEAWAEYFPKNEEGNYDWNTLQKAMITYSHMLTLGVGNKLTSTPAPWARVKETMEADFLALQGKNPVTKASAKELGINYDKQVTEVQINESFNKKYNELVTDPKFKGQYILNPINGKIAPKKGSALETQIKNLNAAKNNMLQFKDLTAIQNDIMSRQKAQKGKIKGTIAGKAEIFTKEKQAAQLGQTINNSLKNEGSYKLNNLKDAQLLAELPPDMFEFAVAGPTRNVELKASLKQLQAQAKNHVEYLNQFAPGKNNSLREPISNKLFELGTAKENVVNLKKYQQSPEGKVDPTVETKILRAEERVDELNKSLEVDLTKASEEATLRREADIAKAKERVGAEAIEEYSQAEYIKKAKEAGLDVGKGEQEGFFVGKDNTGKERILINKDWAKEVNNVSVGTHEVLHKLTKDALPEGTTESNRLISEFKKSLTYDQYNTIKDAVESTSAFKKNPNTVEWINVFQDAVRKGDIPPTSKGWKGIGDVFEQVFRKGGFEKIEFKTGKDVYDYVMDYAAKDKAPELKAQKIKAEEVKVKKAAEEEGQFSGKQELEAERKALMDKQLELGREKAGSKLYEQNKARIQEISRELKGEAVKLKNLSQKDRDSFITSKGKQLNELWTEDLRNLKKMDKIIDEMVENHAYKRGLDKLPDFRMDEFIAETRRGVNEKTGTLRGLDRFIWGQNKFEPTKSNENFYGYLNRFLRNSADNALKSGKVTSKVFKGELSGKEPTPASEPVEPTIVKSKAREIVGIKTKEELTKLREEGKLSKAEYDQQLKRYSEIENKVVDYLQKEVLKDEVVTEKLGKELNDYLRKELAADIRGEMGKGTAYEEFIEKAYDEVLKPLSEQPGPVNDIFTRAKQRDLWYEGTGKRYVKIKGKSQPELMRKITPSKERVKDYYLKQGDFAKAPNSKGNLKIALSEQLSEIIGKDIMPSLLNSGKAFKGLSPENKALINKDVTTGLISDMIKRNPDLQFSETVKKRIPEFGQNTFDSFRLMKVDHPKLFNEFRAAVLAGVEKQWLEANPNFNKYLEQPILRAAKRKALAARKESQSFKKGVQDLPDKVMWNGKEIDISSLKNADWNPMSGDYKGGKYYDTNIIKPYLKHAGKFAEYLPKWLTKMANKEAVLQTLGSSTQATGRSVSTITESIDYQSGRKGYNPNKPVKYKYDLLTGKEIGADPTIKNQAETLMNSLGKNESKVFKALEKEIAELATLEGQKPKKFSEMTDKEITDALSKAGFASDAAMKNVMKKDFSKMTDAERADVLATKINARNNAIRQKVYDAIQQAKEQYIKDAPNEAEALKRMEYILRLQKNNTIHTSAFDRGAVPVEAIYMPKGSKLSDKTIKLEHIKTSVEQSLQVGKAIVEGKWGERGKKIMSDYTGVLAPKELLDIIDAKGGNTNAAKRARMVLDLQRLKDYKVVGPDGKFTESYYDKVINDLASELKLTKGDKAMLKADWIADQVVENIQNPSKVNEIKLKQRLDNAKTYEKQFKENTEIQPSFSQTKKFKSQSEQVSNLSSVDRALELARKQKTKKDIKKARVFDFDDTIARTNSKVFATKGNERKVLTAEQFAKDGERLVNDGWKMDFSDFNKVVEGKKGPLFEVMKKMKEAAGERDLFVLTARAPESAKAIHTFLKEMGIDIPLENITGLGNSTANAKANWIVDKAAEAYNDFYFADDHFANVKAVKDVLNVLDVKGKVQQAKFSETLSKDFNKLLEESTGVEWYKEFSSAKAEMQGALKKERKLILPSSAEDFLGLVYNTLGKGKVGERHLKFYQDNLIKPYNRAVNSLSTDRVNMMADFKALKKQLEVPKDLRKKTKSGWTNEQAVRTYLWNRAGHKVPGLSKADLAEMTKIIENDPKLQAFAEQIELLTKSDGYAEPGQHWLSGTITTDLIKLLNTTKRSKYLQEWQTNVDQIYSKANLNKLEALYGKKYREALENMLQRMKTGSNRSSTGNRLSNQVLDYINQAQGTIMFFNMRSALLQTISSANYINMSFNNPVKAGKAFANQPQYWKDFMELMNSDYLVDRRNGIKINISESEIADAAATSKNKAKAAINYIIEKGYMPTKIADSFAIASGGATWYRNRINDLIKKEGLTESEAKRKAFDEFRDISEISQQSSDPSKISAQQSSDLGRIVLQFVNTPMQYTRIQKRAIQDLANKRGDWKSNAGKILYYGMMQNLWFNAMQQGLFAIGFGDDELNEKEQAKVNSTANGMIDSILRGGGLGGITLSVLKNTVLDIYDRSKRKRPEYGDVWQNLLEFSPAIKNKFNKLKSAAYPFDSKKRRQEVKDKGLSLDNPAWESAAKIISATTNIPLDRLFTKYNNLESAVNEDNEVWERIFNFLGWPEWQLDVEDTDPKKSKYKQPETTSTKKKRKVL